MTHFAMSGHIWPLLKVPDGDSKHLLTKIMLPEDAENEMVE